MNEASFPFALIDVYVFIVHSCYIQYGGDVDVLFSAQCVVYIYMSMLRRPSSICTSSAFLGNTTSALLVAFFRSTVESIVTYCITVWFSQCTEAERKRVVRTDPCPPWKTSVYPTAWDNLFDLLPSGRHYRSIRTRTKRLRDNFFPQAVSVLNSHMHQLQELQWRVNIRLFHLFL